MGFVDRNGPQQLVIGAKPALAAQAQYPLQLAAEEASQLPLAGLVLDIVVHALGRNSAAVAFDLKGLVSQNITVGGEQCAYVLPAL